MSGIWWVLGLRKTHQPLTSPDPDNAETLQIAPVDDSEGGMNQFSDLGLVELGDHPSSVGM